MSGVPTFEAPEFVDKPDDDRAEAGETVPQSGRVVSPPSDETVIPISRSSRKMAKGATSGASTPSPAAPDLMTELDLAEMFAKRCVGLVAYCAALGGWFVFDAFRWALDERESVREMVKDVAREVAAMAAAQLDKDLFKIALRAGSAAGVRAVLELARSMPGIVFAASDADSDPMLLATRGGTIDLRSGAVRAPASDDLITRGTDVICDPDATAPMWMAFLERILPHPELRAYVARLMGYAATGLIREHVLGVFWGPGANGKSVFAEVVMRVLGAYAKPGPSSLIVAARNEVHPTDVASLIGSRLVVVHETRRGASFDASKVKQLTGGDQLTARFMRQDFITFSPTHLLLMLSNYKPRADASDKALWRRVQLVPFTVTIPEEERDPQLAERILREEAAGVLNWIVAGCLEWQRIGLAPPDIVREQTEAYRAAEDVIGAFIDERCVMLREATVRGGALYKAFEAWSDEQGVRPMRGRDFAAEIIGRGFEKTRDRRGALYRGIGLAADVEREGAFADDE